MQSVLLPTAEGLCARRAVAAADRCPAPCNLQAPAHFTPRLGLRGNIKQFCVGAQLKSRAGRISRSRQLQVIRAGADQVQAHAIFIRL